MEYSGNQEILNLPKTGFLCSRKCPATVVLESYEWAKTQRKAGVCVVSGNHSQIEKDVFEILLKGKQPLILVLARGMKKHWEPEILQAIADHRLLIISPFEQAVTRITKETALQRNRLILELSNRHFIPYVQKGGMLEGLVGDFY